MRGWEIAKRARRRVRRNGARVGLTLLLATVGAAVVGVPPVGAGTIVQVGQTAPGNPTNCISGNRIQSIVSSGPSYTVPSAGTITSWSHKGLNANPGSGRLQIWRFVSGTTYTLVARSAIETFAAGVLNTFTVNIAVQAGDVIGLRTSTDGGCLFTTGAGAADQWIPSMNTSAPSGPGDTKEFATVLDDRRINISTTFDPAGDPPNGGDPPSGDPPGNEAVPTLDASAKGEQKAKKLKITATCDVDCTLDTSGKAKLPTGGAKKSGTSRSKTKTYKLKPKSFELQAGVATTVPLKFKKKSSVKKITKLLKSDKKAKRKSKVIAKLAASNAVGSTSEKLKIKPKP